MYIVAFNGPPRCGKDTMSHMLAAHLDKVSDLPVIEASLSTPLRRVAYAMTSWGGALDGDDYEKFKLTHFAEFGKDGRQIMIDVSEQFLKPRYGKEIMTRMLLHSLTGFDGIVLVRDSGFQIEVTPLATWVGADNLYVVRVARKGCDFSNDSRESVTGPKWNADVANNGTLLDLQTEAIRMYGRMVNQLGWKL